MAKEDFCFTYYDGDACRDMSHMNRLERGAYSDIVLAQRKFGRLTLDQIKKILGKDFEECWPSVNLVLIFDTADQKYYVEWLEKSIVKMKKHSKKQSENVTKRYQRPTNQIPKSRTEEPLEDGDGNENELKNKKESSEKTQDDGFQYEYKPGDDDRLHDVEIWTNEVLEGNDVYFINMIRGEQIVLNGALDRLARDHLGKTARYNWQAKMTTQQAFRHSLINYIKENLNKQPNGTSTKGTHGPAGSPQPGKDYREGF